jgi:hypothetical protein
MKKSEYIFKSFINASGVFIYVSAIAWFFSNAQTIFGGKEDNSFLIPIFMLLLFIISASITGLLVLGKPIILYFNGHKKESVILLFSTLAWLGFYAFVVAIGLLVL